MYLYYQYGPKLRKLLFALLVVCAPFSFVPSVALPIENFSSFRIGLYQLCSAAFVLLCLPEVIRAYVKTKQGPEDRYIYGSVVLLLGIAAIGLSSAIRPGRSLLLAMSFALLLLVMVCARWYVRTHGGMGSIYPMMLKAGIGYGLLSIAQLIVATFQSEYVLLCRGCGPEVFGFPRINVFAAEPLFWANALLPFWLVSLHSYATDRLNISRAALILTTIAVTLTFSRGAYLAMAVMFAVYMLLARKRLVRTMGIMAVSALMAITLMVMSAQVRYRDSSGVARETLSGIVEQLSFGRLRIVPEVTPMQTEAVSMPLVQESFDSEGYVEASTNDRTTSARNALNAWVKSGRTLTGLGLGNLGPYVQSRVDAGSPPDLTVYIYYVLVLTEMGILGLVLFVGLYVAAWRRLYRLGSTDALLIMVVLIGFAVQYLFFGSYINVVYIWLWLGIGLGYHKSNEKEPAKKRLAVRQV